MTSLTAKNAYTSMWGAHMCLRGFKTSQIAAVASAVTKTATSTMSGWWRYTIASAKALRSSICDFWTPRHHF